MEEKYKRAIAKKKAEVRKSIKRVPSYKLKNISSRHYNKLKLYNHHLKSLIRLRKIFEK